jgi:hypothetical protein
MLTLAQCIEINSKMIKNKLLVSRPLQRHQRMAEAT